MSHIPYAVYSDDVDSDANDNDASLLRNVLCSPSNECRSLLWRCLDSRACHKIYEPLERTNLTHTIKPKRFRCHLSYSWSIQNSLNRWTCSSPGCADFHCTSSTTFSDFLHFERCSADFHRAIGRDINLIHDLKAVKFSAKSVLVREKRILPWNLWNFVNFNQFMLICEDFRTFSYFNADIVFLCLPDFKRVAWLNSQRLTTGERYAGNIVR